MNEMHLHDLGGIVTVARYVNHVLHRSDFEEVRLDVRAA